MERERFKHGFDESAWEAGKKEARQIMYAVAKKRDFVSYSDLVAQISAVHMEAHDPRLAHFLGQIAREDDDQGLGLTTVVVVHKSGDKQPGPGFFEMAASQGRNVKDKIACWMKELNVVYDHWA